MRGNQYLNHRRRGRKGRRNQRQKSARKYGSDYQETDVVKGPRLPPGLPGRTPSFPHGPLGPTPRIQPGTL